MKPEVLEAYAVEFDRCAKFIEPAIDRFGFGNLDVGDVKAYVMAGKMQLWPAENSALVTEIIEHPARTCLHVAFAGGQFEELAALAPIIKRWAIEKGCDHWTCSGRDGWARALGFGSKAYTVYREDF